MPPRGGGRRAGVSKGGLLYHFPSKDQLSEALCDRLVALAADDVEAMRTSADGPARHYIRTSHYADTPLDRTFVAVARLQQAGDPRARAAIRQISEQWLDTLDEALGDRDAARAIKLIGDGLYHNAMSSTLGGQHRRPRSTKVCWPLSTGSAARVRRPRTPSAVRPVRRTSCPDSSASTPPG